MGSVHADVRALGGMMQESLSAAENYRRLSKCFSGWQTEELHRMGREARALGACIGGICALVMEETPTLPPAIPDTGTVAVRLKKAYARAMHLLTACERYGTDPEYGPVFQSLVIRQQDHCRKILEIIGSL